MIVKFTTLFFMNKAKFVLAFLLVSSGCFVHAQESPVYFVTIGVFGRMDNTTRLVAKANQQGYEANYVVDNVRKLNYVYVLKTSEKRKAFAYAIKLRAETEYRDAWVFISNLEGASPEELPQIEEKKSEPIVEIVPVPKEPESAIDSSLIAANPVEVVEVKKPVGKAFYFRLINAGDGSEIKSGEVHIQEAIRATQYQTFRPGELVYLEAPKNARGSYTVITQIAGYSPTSSVFNYQNPSARKGNQEELIIELSLKKAKKGDYVDFSSVKFFTNASLLQPASQNELDGLADLMKENLKYRIKIHGHVNGSRDRESITRSEKSGFFGLNSGVDKVTKKMSAKDLSTARAESIRDYLVSQGIEASRIKIKGDGSQIPLYPETGIYGQYNDRVEIEFLKN